MQTVAEIVSGPAIHEEYAAQDFDAWVHQPDEWTPPTNKEWAGLANPYLVAVRLAWITLYKSKPELIEMLRSMDDESVFEAYADSIKDSIDFFKIFQTVLETAYFRILCAAANAVDEGGAA